MWVITEKKAVTPTAPTYADMVEEALCFGWVDSKPRRLDDTRKMLWFAPRKPQSGWSRINKERVERLTGLGLMMPPGLAKVAAAQADGSWDRLDSIENLEIPSDLAQRLDGYPHARAFFDGFPRSAKRSILEWIAQAKTPDTRARRIDETARLADQNTRANQWRNRN